MKKVQHSIAHCGEDGPGLRAVGGSIVPVHVAHHRSRKALGYQLLNYLWKVCVDVSQHE